MPITYPRTLPPELVMSAVNVEPVYVVTGPRRTMGGAVIATEVADPYWSFDVQMRGATVERVNALRAWKSTLRGGMKSFLAHNHAAPRPTAYATDAAVLALTRAGGGAFNGTAIVTSFPASHQIAISSASASRVPAGFQMRAGDMVGLVKSGSPNKYFLHRVTENSTADGSGNLTLSVEPFVLTNIFAAGDVINFIKPLGEFVLDPNDQDDGFITRSDNQFSLKAYSKIS